MTSVSTNPEELPALLQHVSQAVGGGQVLVQVPLVWLAKRGLPVHHPETEPQTNNEVHLDFCHPCRREPAWELFHPLFPVRYPTYTLMFI